MPNHRRAVLAALLGAPVAACQTMRSAQLPPGMEDQARWYIGSRRDGPYDMALVDRSLLDPDLAPRTVAFGGGHRAGSVVVDIDERRLYYANGDGTATRYGVAVGKQGFSWQGTAYVGRKAAWPNWSPTSVMVQINPKLARYASGGPANPLGARALYLYQGGGDTFFRIHGTNEPWSIGRQVSSGCIRLLNEDVVELYEKVAMGATVSVRRSGRMSA